MRYLEKLINELCNNNIKYQFIKELAEVGTGSSNGNEAQEDGSYPFFIRSQTVKCKNDWEYDEEAIIIPGEGGIGEIYHYVNGKYAIHQRVYRIHFIDESVNVKFAFHYFRACFKQFIIRKAVSATVKSIRKPMIEDFSIPIPPLKIQKEIVRILDTFTELTTALTTELTTRKKQYNYYRNQLLSFKEEEVEWKPLGKIVLSTSNIRWQDTKKSYRYIDLTSVCREKSTIIETIEITKNNAPSRAQKLILKDDVIFATTRPTQQRLCLISEEYSGEVASTGYCVLRANTDVVLPKWIYFWLTSNKFKNYVEENQSGSAYPAISDAKVKEFQIPIPPLEEQKRIVSILDKFDTLTTSISEGLPREIELRKKQYEYHRDLLLSFPKDNLKE